jgi:integrase
MSKDVDQLDLFDESVPPPELETQTAAPTPPLKTAQDLLDWVKGDATRTRNQKKNEASAIRWLGRIDDTPLSAIPLEARYLVDDRIRKIRLLKMDKRRVSDIVSYLNAALIRAGVLALGARRRGDVSHKWAELLARISNQGQRNAVATFARYCSQRGIEPSDVTMDTWNGFAEETLYRSSHGNPRALILKIIRFSHDPASSVADWPLPALPKLANPRIYRVNKDQLPQSFWKDADAYVLASSTPPENIFDTGVARQLRPDTLQRYREVLCRTASAQIHAGRDPLEIVDLRSLLDVEWLERGTTWLHKRSGGKFLKDHLNCAAAWISMADGYVRVPEPTMKALRNIINTIKKALGTATFSEKNMHKLDQFSDAETVREFLMLPYTILSAVNKKKVLSPQDLSEMTAAVAIELLLGTMVRRKNLTNLDLAKHFWPATPTKGAKWSIFIEASEVKNDQDLAFPLMPQTIRLLQHYLKVYRPQLQKSPTSRLFLRKDGSPFSPAQLAGLVHRTIHRHLGIDVNVHLFRHIGTMLYLDAHPGNFGVPQRILGHKSEVTTQRFYARLEATKAIKHFTAAVLGERNQCIAKLKLA